MGQHAVVRKKRKNKEIIDNSPIFSSFMEKKDYENAGKIAFLTALQVGSVKGFMNALDNANSFIKRKKIRMGL